jgi:hypothetical protein
MIARVLPREFNDKLAGWGEGGCGTAGVAMGAISVGGEAGDVARLTDEAESLVGVAAAGAAVVAEAAAGD